MLNFWKYLALFGLSTFKFLFTPFTSIPMKLSFMEVWISCTSGAIFASTIFYFASGYFFKQAKEKKRLKLLEAEKNGLHLKIKNFTRFNKLIVRTKMALGFYGIVFIAPVIASIPVGTIIVAKFYGSEKRTYPIMICGLIVSGLILSSLAWLMTSK
jgi:hypothetical protein